ncbi:MAG: ATP-binding protein [Firmicutes bacterium]|nr:ATP-binding protein [Bacillota bacterium]
MTKHINFSVKGKMAFLAAVVVAVALSASAYSLVYILKSSVENQGRSAAKLETQLIYSLISKGDIPFLLPVGQQDLFAQVITEQNTILSSTPNISPKQLLIRKNSIGGNKINFYHAINIQDNDQNKHQDADGPYIVMTTQERIPLHDQHIAKDFEATYRLSKYKLHNKNNIYLNSYDQYLVTAPKPLAKRVVYVVVAVSLATGWNAVDQLRGILLIGVPILVLTVAIIVFWLSAKALAPVRAIREEVAEISLNDLHRRVPEPGTSDEIGQLAKTMNDVLDRLESSAVKQRRFVADASHELRTPLATLAAGLDVAVTHPESISPGETLRDALSAARRLARIVDELLILAQMDEGRLALDKAAQVDLDDLVLEETAFNLKPEKLTLDLSKLSAGRVMGDKDSLRRVVANLLDNAYKYANSFVYVAVFSQNNKSILEIGDDGPGIDEKSAKMIFERFTRLDDARGNDKGGAGLGLALVKEIVELHAGTITVANSKLARGACFRVELPSA